MEVLLINQLAVFFVVVDPIVVALMFYLMTLKVSGRRRRQIALGR